MNSRVSAQLAHCYRFPLHKTWQGDDPKPAFINREFNPDNWNDQRLNLLKSLLRVAAYQCGREFDWDGKNARIIHGWCEDENYYFIRVHEDGAPGSIYQIEWYKDRGRTDVLNLDGRPMTEQECYDLTKHLAEAFGDALGAILKERAEAQ